MGVHFWEKLYFLLIRYIKLIGHCSDCSSVSKKKKKVRSEEKTKISITFTAAAEGEQNQ